MSFLELLAQTTQSTTTSSGGSPPFWYSLTKSGPLVPMMLAIGVLYFFMIRSRRNQDKQKRQMLETMKKGDRIQTIGGILGSVVDPREDRVLVKVDESSNTKIWFSRTSIARVLTDDKAEVK